MPNRYDNLIKLAYQVGEKKRALQSRGLDIEERSSLRKQSASLYDSDSRMHHADRSLQERILSQSQYTRSQEDGLAHPPGEGEAQAAQAAPMPFREMSVLREERPVPGMHGDPGGEQAQRYIEADRMRMRVLERSHEGIESLLGPRREQQSRRNRFEVGTSAQNDFPLAQYRPAQAQGGAAAPAQAQGGAAAPAQAPEGGEAVPQKAGTFDNMTDHERRMYFSRAGFRNNHSEASSAGYETDKRIRIENEKRRAAKAAATQEGLNSLKPTDGLHGKASSGKQVDQVEQPSVSTPSGRPTLFVSGAQPAPTEPVQRTPSGQPEVRVKIQPESAQRTPSGQPTKPVQYLNPEGARFKIQPPSGQPTEPVQYLNPEGARFKIQPESAQRKVATRGLNPEGLRLKGQPPLSAFNRLRMKRFDPKNPASHSGGMRA